MSMRFDIIPTSISDLNVVQRKPLSDTRGFFERMFCATELQTLIGTRQIVQINRSHTRHRGCVRGMHFQRSPYSELKAVSCLKGEAFDVAVDLRPGSPTFLHWHGEILSGGNHKSLFIPEGFAHGFQSLTDECELLYLHTAPYTASAEGGVNAQDSRLAIKWPLPMTGLSQRDATLPYLNELNIETVLL